MYSGSIRYRVYKKDITHYRIEAFVQGNWKEITNGDWPETLTLFNCKLVTLEDERLKTIQGLDGEAAPVCAWIECEGYIRQNISLSSVLYFNPYRVSTFVDRSTFEPIHRAKVVTINGNLLNYSLT